jgi:hypothetical protein
MLRATANMPHAPLASFVLVLTLISSKWRGFPSLRSEDANMVVEGGLERCFSVA